MKVTIKDNSMNPNGWNVGDVVELFEKDGLNKLLLEGKVVEYKAPLTDDEKKKKWLAELVDSGVVTLKQEEQKVEPLKVDPVIEKPLPVKKKGK